MAGLARKFQILSEKLDLEPSVHLLSFTAVSGRIDAQSLRQWRSKRLSAEPIHREEMCREQTFVALPDPM
jgi:hypothetical protein